jgi:hypothetical protein
MELLRANLWEIKKSGSLKTLGGLVALFHCLQFYFWYDGGNLPLKYVSQGQPMCWSWFENCGWLRAMPFGLLESIYAAYGVLMILAALVLLVTEWVSFGFYLLVLGLIFSMTLYFQDLRLSSNEGYFILFLTFSYLFIPSKHRLMRRMVVSFFIAEGLAQASPDWLGGSWYIEHLHVPVKLGEWLAAVSVIAHMIGGASLLFRDGRYFWTGWIGLFFYECTHLYIGELLSSAIGLGVLLYLALDELELRKAEREYLYQSFIRPEPSFIWGGILLAFFWAAQLTPFFGLGRDSKIKSFLDVWAIHPKAAHEECEQKSYIVYKDRIEEVEVEPSAARQPAMYCNVYLRYLDLKALCRQEKEKYPNEFVTVSSVMQVRQLRPKATFRAFEVRDFCAENLTFKRLGDVQWTMNPGK